MTKENERRISRIRKLIIVCTITAVILSVSTYAWFIGMQTVHVTSFDIEIAVTDSLLLSLDGASWDTSVSISKETLDAVSYVGHTNSWGAEIWGSDGLIPMSSIGEMDATVSRMKLFEKASLTASPGGFRLLASRVDNYNVGQTEQHGYVAFDLFIKNFSGTQYIEELDPLDEEAIYLTVDSVVKVGAAGVAETGIENSIRLAFGQIGRVIATTTEAATITGITCTDAGDVTGICRTAQIWEPNDTHHNENAISWYETACLARTGIDVTLPASYGGSCGLIIDGLAYPTYAVKAPITSADNVDVYDGAEYNTYEDTTLLESYSYFTDTMKLLRGTSRPLFMTLAPNSITKVRIYIYLEGQDIDNYDFSLVGKQVAINFGFTKQRFTEDDIEYDGPDVNQGEGPDGADLTPPVITLLGDNPMTVIVDGEFVDPGATATDNVDLDVTDDIVATGTVNTEVIGTYYITYTVTDTAGNTATKVRTVTVAAE
jgi:hypothetical protein